jgi:2-polyprenyl-6-methoxyphenol hydroxylase-like FAD-dependent oxidoreductase
VSTSRTDETLTADVLIVGGGIAGAALAARLAPLGWKIVLVERNAGALDTARGDHLQPYTAELLDQWGLLQRFMAAGAEKRMGTLWKAVDGEVLLDGAVDDLPIPHPYYLYLNHERISEVFLAAAAENPGFRLLRPASFKGLDYSGDETVALIRSAGRPNLRIKAGLIVGADGRGSGVRNAAGIDSERYDYHNPIAIVFAKPFRSDPRNELVAYACDCGSVLVVPRTGGGWKLGVPVPKSDLKFWKNAAPDDIKDWFSSQIPDIRFSEPTAATFYPVQMVSARPWVKENVVVIGDACHALHPARGLGMSMGLRCVDELATALANCGDKPTANELCASAKDFEAQTAPMIRAIEEENHRQGILMDEAGAMPVPAVHEFLKSIAGDPNRLSAYRLQLAGYA